MLRRLIIVTAVAAGMCVTAVTLAAPALAKGPSQARITGPGLAHAMVVSGSGEPGQLSTLARLAEQTGLFTVLFGGAVGDMFSPARLGAAPPAASLGPRYTVTYTVPGVTPRPGERFGRVRQDLYPRAAGGPVIYTPPGQAGFGQPLRLTGWAQGSAPLASTLAKLGVPPRQHAPRHTHAAAAHPARHASGQAIGWLVGSGVAVIIAGLGAVAWRLRLRRRPAPGRA